jgi:cytochrome c-type biogenesis protein CcmF
MAAHIEQPKNQLILEISDNGKTEEGRPQLYYSKRMDGLMKRPYIKRELLYDLYFSPQDIRQEQPQQGLVLSKGNPVKAGGFEFRFTGFDMGQHGEGQSMKVTANIVASRDDTEDTLRPSQTFLMTEQGSTSMEQPAEFSDGSNTYLMTITRIMADQGAVMVDIPGLVGMAGSERLLMDISKKPLIILVWVGTTLILIGGLIVFIRRRRELAAA